MVLSQKRHRCRSSLAAYPVIRPVFDCLLGRNSDGLRIYEQLRALRNGRGQVHYSPDGSVRRKSLTTDC